MEKNLGELVLFGPRRTGCERPRSTPTSARELHKVLTGISLLYTPDFLLQVCYNIRASNRPNMNQQYLFYKPFENS
jgi:hypothetical protein